MSEMQVFHIRQNIFPSAIFGFMTIFFSIELFEDLAYATSFDLHFYINVIQDSVGVLIFLGMDIILLTHKIVVIDDVQFEVVNLIRRKRYNVNDIKGYDPLYGLILKSTNKYINMHVGMKYSPVDEYKKWIQSTFERLEVEKPRYFKFKK